MEERKYILEATAFVDSVIGFDDDDGTANDVSNQVRPNIFANGGDRNETNTVSGVGVIHVFGVGGDKKNSSSSILRK